MQQTAPRSFGSDLLRDYYNRMMALDVRSDPFQLLLLEKDVFELAMKTPALSALSWCLSRSRTPDIEESQRSAYRVLVADVFAYESLSIGKWGDLAGRLLKVGACDELPPIKAVLEDILSLFQNNGIPHWRNEVIGHGATRSPSDRAFIADLETKRDLITTHFLNNAEYYDVIEIRAGNDKRPLSIGAGSSQLDDPAFLYGPSGFFDYYDTRRHGRFFFLDYGSCLREACEVGQLRDFVGSIERVRLPNLDDRVSDLGYTGLQRDLVERLRLHDTWSEPSFVVKRVFNALNGSRTVLLRMDRGIGKSALAQGLASLGQNELRNRDPNHGDWRVKALFLDSQFTCLYDYLLQSFAAELPAASLSLISRANPEGQCTRLLEFASRSFGRGEHLLLLVDGIDQIPIRGLARLLPELEAIAQSPTGPRLLLTASTSAEVVQGSPELEHLITDFSSRLGSLYDKVEVRINDPEYQTFVRKHWRGNPGYDRGERHISELVFLERLGSCLPKKAKDAPKVGLGAYLDSIEPRMGPIQAGLFRGLLGCLAACPFPLDRRELVILVDPAGLTLRWLGILFDASPFLVERPGLRRPFLDFTRAEYRDEAFDRCRAEREKLLEAWLAESRLVEPDDIGELNDIELYKLCAGLGLGAGQPRSFEESRRALDLLSAIVSLLLSGPVSVPFYIPEATERQLAIGEMAIAIARDIVRDIRERLPEGLDPEYLTFAEFRLEIDNCELLWQKREVEQCTASARRAQELAVAARDYPYRAAESIRLNLLCVERWLGLKGDDDQEFREAISARAEHLSSEGVSTPCDDQYIESVIIELSLAVNDERYQDGCFDRARDLIKALNEDTNDTSKIMVLVRLLSLSACAEMAFWNVGAAWRLFGEAGELAARLNDDSSRYVLWRDMLGLESDLFVFHPRNDRALKAFQYYFDEKRHWSDVGVVADNEDIIRDRYERLLQELWRFDEVRSLPVNRSAALVPSNLLDYLDLMQRMDRAEAGEAVDLDEIDTDVQKAERSASSFYQRVDAAKLRFRLALLRNRVAEARDIADECASWFDEDRGRARWRLDRQLDFLQYIAGYFTRRDAYAESEAYRARFVEIVEPFTDESFDPDQRLVALRKLTEIDSLSPGANVDSILGYANEYETIYVGLSGEDKLNHEHELVSVISSCIRAITAATVWPATKSNGQSLPPSVRPIVTPATASMRYAFLKEYEKKLKEHEDYLAFCPEMRRMSMVYAAFFDFAAGEYASSLVALAAVADSMAKAARLSDDFPFDDSTAYQIAALAASLADHSDSLTGDQRAELDRLDGVVENLIAMAGAETEG